jgi:hypothetical protein
VVVNICVLMLLYMCPHGVMWVVVKSAGEKPRVGRRVRALRVLCVIYSIRLAASIRHTSADVC